MDFFKAACQEAPTQASRFGLCDDQDGTKAYTDFYNEKKWIATVKNDHHFSLTFIAVDKCVIFDDEAIGRGRCDGLLTSNEHIYFVELKDQAKEWIQGAIEQLESTIQFFIEYHDLSLYKHKKAFACDKKHRHFQEIDNERNLSFFRRYGVRIDVQTKIIVV